VLLRPPALAVIATALVACGPAELTGGAARDTQAIIGGTAAAATDAPSAGAMLIDITLLSTGSFICTGTLIAPDVVLTAAHCVDDAQASLPGTTTYFTFDLDVSAYGVSSNTLPAGSVLVKKMVRDAAFSAVAENTTTGLADLHDLGLLFLSTPVTTVTPEVMADVN
jgi:V8-like Glu-specific endopeptidase